jgi:hypothetical protein
MHVKIGHKYKIFWELESNKDKTPESGTRITKKSKKQKGKQNNPAPNVVHWTCNQKEHIQTNCPNNKKQESGIMATQKEDAEAIETEVYFVAINESTKKWICGLRILEHQLI